MKKCVSFVLAVAQVERLVNVTRVLHARHDTKWQLNIDKHKGEKLENVLSQLFISKMGTEVAVAVVMRKKFASTHTDREK